MKKLKTFIKQFKISTFIILMVAGMINAVGVNLFLSPLKIFDNGISGTAQLVSVFTADFLPFFALLVILNIPFFIIGFKKIGAKFFVQSIWAILMYSLFSFLINNVLPFDFSAGSPVVKEDVALASIFGGLLSGIASGTIIRNNASLDGMEICAIMFAKKLNITIGTFVMIFNVFLYALGAVLLNSWTIALYSVIAYAVGLKAIDFVVDGLDKGKALIIITRKEKEISNELSSIYHKGVTIMDGLGYFSQENKKIIYCVVNRFELARVRESIQNIDADCFITVTEISDFVGGKHQGDEKQNYLKMIVGSKKKK